MYTTHSFSLADSQNEAASTHRSDVASARKGTKSRSAEETLKDIERVLKQAHDTGRDVGGWGGLFPLHRAAERGDIEALSAHAQRGVFHKRSEMAPAEHRATMLCCATAMIVCTLLYFYSLEIRILWTGPA